MLGHAAAEGHANLSDLHGHPESWCSLGQGCYWRPHLRPMDLLQPGSKLMSMAPVITEGCADAWVLVSHLRPCWFSRVMLLPGPYWSVWPMLPPRPWWQPGPSCCQGHVWVHGSAAAGACVVVYGLCYHKGSWELWLLKSKGRAEPVLLFTGPGIAHPIPNWTVQQDSWPYLSWKSWHLNSGEIAPPLMTGIGELALMAWA